MRKSTGNNAPVRTVSKAAMASGGGGKVIKKTRNISAPTPPAPASMKNMGGKLRNGAC